MKKHKIWFVAGYVYQLEFLHDYLTKAKNIKYVLLFPINPCFVKLLK